MKNLLDKRKVRVLPEHTDPKKLADEFNDYYMEKINKFRETIPKNSTGIQLHRNVFTGIKLDRLEPLDKEELKEIINKFGIKTSTEDPLPAKFLKQVIDEALPILVQLVQA